MRKLFLLTVSALLLFAACVPSTANKPAKTEPDTSAATAQPTAPAADAQTQTKVQLNTAFAARLVQFLEDNGYAEENYIVSPTSFRAALCLAIAGAEGTTKDELLKAAGFESMEDANAWYAGVLASVDAFQTDLDEYNRRVDEWMGGEGKADRAFSVVNSVWNNSDLRGDFSEAYRQYVLEHYGAAANSIGAAELTKAVNDWCSEQTHGMIPEIAGDLSRVSSVLVNALYLRTSWLDSFPQYLTKTDRFVCADGAETEKEFMEQTESFAYYADDETQLVVLPMQGDMYFVCVLGSADGLSEKLAKKEFCTVHVKLPKLEIESSFSDSELVRYLISLGAVSAFDPTAADFSGMSDVPWYVSDIIQKAKIKTDEDGIEAAAVTAIMMAEGAFIGEEPVIREFIADRPFRFYVYSGLYEESPELLFYGQCVK